MRGVEGSPEVRAAVVRIIRRAEATPAGVVVASQLARAECLVGPERARNQVLRQRFEDFFSESGIILVDVTNEILAKAVELRAHRMLKMPDAIHVATALVAGCDVIVSTDSDIHERGPFGSLRVEAFPP